jgi:uncharacterized protein
MITDEIRSLVKKACENPENVFSPDFFDEHLLVVEKYGKELCDILKGDSEIVSLSSYLHDISAVFDIKTIATHNVNSSEIAGDMLNQHGYPLEKIEKVKNSILKHSSPLKIGEGSIEEICLSNADAISQIVNPSYWLFFAFKIRSMSFTEGKKWYLAKVESNWNSIIEPAREIVENRYMIVKEALVISKYSNV